MLLILIIPFLVFSIIVAVNFFYHVFNDRFYSPSGLIRLAEIWTVLIAPIIFLSFFDLTEKNNCCSDSAVFAPDNRIGIYSLIILSIASYFYSSFRKQPATPIVELLINSVIILGVCLNILVALHINTQDFGSFMWFLGNVPIMMLFILVMKKNKKLLDSSFQHDLAKPNNALVALSLKILQAKAWIRFPVLTLLALPLLLLASLILFLFGQKPDSLIRAFTDTYKHGFSQLDYMCDNVQCGGHFLCSVAAKGHKSIVQPERYGERNGHKIICNRQLLVANAFEELIQLRLPFVHKQVRKRYNKVGNFVHRYYKVFEIKLVADIVYILMKPLEWFFLVVLYTFDARPEDRIASQYLSLNDRMKLRNLSATQQQFQKLA